MNKDTGMRADRMASSDLNQDLKIKARRRLIGAITLVLTAVIVVPMLLDSEPRPLNQNIPVEIPSKNTPFTPKLEPVKPSASAVAESDSSKSASAPVSSEPPKTVAAGSVTPLPNKETALEAEKPEVKNGEVKKIEPPKTPPPKQETKPARTDDGSQAKALLEGKPGASQEPAKEAPVKSEPVKSEPTKANPVQAGKYLIQVAAYSKDEQAQAWVKKLKAAGFQAYTEKVTTSGGVRIRVRVGPFSTQAEANKALTRIKALGGSEARLVN
ncbi:MAG: SPOR domain-containing protein [Burkholderiales bacterium]|jgi:DedD protein